MKNKSLVFIGAHPDDETFGIGATLAQYSASGVQVYYICATQGEVGASNPESMQGFSSVGEMRWNELKCASQVLGLKDIFYLGYRDSGMANTADNQHPEAFINAPVEQVAERIVKILREIQPQVIVTFDPIGRYRHPDHIAAHKAAVRAFFAVSDPSQFPQAGAVYQPKKLYFHVRNRGWLKIAIKLMPLFGKNPRKFGRNKDIDLTKMQEEEFPIHVKLRIGKKYLKIRTQAAHCHKSQTGGAPAPGIFRLVNKLSESRDCFMRAYPPVKGKLRESDLFDGI